MENQEKTPITFEYIMEICTKSIKELKQNYQMMLDAISVYASWMSLEQIQTCFEFSDAEMEDENIKEAFKYGQSEMVRIAGFEKVKIAFGGNLKALDYLLNINGARQPEVRQYQFNYNQKGDEDWDSLKKSSDFN